MKYFFVCALFILFSSFSVIETRKIAADPSASSVMYFMSHPMHDWDASAKSFKTVILYDDAAKSINSVAVAISVRSFDSGNSNRDSEMVAVLDALKHPNVTFTSSDVKQNGDALTLNGKLTFKGVTKPFVVTAVRKDAKSLLTVSGKMNVNMTDFDVKPPSLLGISVRENIRLDFTMTFRM